MGLAYSAFSAMSVSNEWRDEMTNVRAKGDFALNMGNLNFYSLLDLNAHTTKSTLFGAYSLAGYNTEIRGTGFKYDAGVPTGGAATSFDFYKSGLLSSQVTGFTADLKMIASAAKTGSLTDDAKIFASILKGGDTIVGGKAADNLFGLSGNDTIKGGSGKDVIAGGLGADKLWGGFGDDTFVFASAAESTSKAADTIYDLQLGDRIDLSKIDANSTKAGNQSFHLVEKYTGKAGELVSTSTKIMADTNGDGHTDFMLKLNAEADFIIL